MVANSLQMHRMAPALWGMPGCVAAGPPVRLEAY